MSLMSIDCIDFIGHAKGLRIVVGRVPQVRCYNCICKLHEDYYRHREI